MTTKQPLWGVGGRCCLIISDRWLMTGVWRFVAVTMRGVLDGLQYQYHLPACGGVECRGAVKVSCRVVCLHQVGREMKCLQTALDNGLREGRRAKCVVDGAAPDRTGPACWLDWKKLPGASNSKLDRRSHARCMWWWPPHPSPNQSFKLPKLQAPIKLHCMAPWHGMAWAGEREQKLTGTGADGDGTQTRPEPTPATHSA
ncbi:hypothetical protein B0T22DRAFT_166741 [Podospora appendiculata]|uniref:Uncharacterized protein n=1 Tax=Podospora appendiculata TaxID=314037 RepID=A0AAE1CD02_9PEZI|nr:hypothetical protein B0T22DRAFT_166741 [Podospora appendiculata]